VETTASVSATGISTQKRGALAAAIVVIIASVLATATSVSAQPGPAATCSGAVSTTFGTAYYGFEDFGNRLFSTSVLSRDFALSSPLEAGTYDLDGVSYDGYINREATVPQTREQWYAVLLAADGSILATSGTTGDVADQVEEATWSGDLGEVTIAQTATTVRTVHAAPGSLSSNSVRPVCFGATRNEPAPDSMITVDFDSTAETASSVTLTCGALEESAMGTSVDLVLENVPASSGCAVRYPADQLCSVAVTPASGQGAMTQGGVNIGIPDAGGADILVDIDCDPALVAGVTVTATTTTVPAAVAPVVTAPTAQAQDGTPAFTG
jgi:hypothetical protein